MNRRKLNIVIFVISLSLALIFSMLCIHVYLYESLSDKNTTLFSATIKEESILETSAEDYIGIIDTEEYHSSLMVKNIDGLIYSDSFQNLHPGETIYFRVQNLSKLPFSLTDSEHIRKYPEHLQKFYKWIYLSQYLNHDTLLEPFLPVPKNDSLYF